MMVKLIARMGLISMLFFTAVLSAARAMGTGQAPNAAVAGFYEGCEEKAQPCWYGIRPGLMKPAEAAAILNAYGFSAPRRDGTGYLFNNDLFIQSHPGAVRKSRMHSGW